MTDSTPVDGRIADVTDPGTRGPVLDEAVAVVGRGELLVLPTDTVYGLGADAFCAPAVAALLAAKGRGRAMPPPVLMADVRTLDGLARDLRMQARALAEAFWPGALTLVVDAQPSLAWDLGDTHGTVALRVPDHEVALAVLARTGPLAVSSANRTGRPAATTAAQAAQQLGDSVRLYLDAGPAPGGVASTIVDARTLQVLRAGAIDLAALRAVAPAVSDPARTDPASVDPAAADPAGPPPA